MGCRFPGQVVTPQDLWRLLVHPAGDVAVSWSPESGLDPNGSMRQAAMLQPGDRFDAASLSIPHHASTGLDARQAQILEVVRQALQDAGISPENLRQVHAGLYVAGLAPDAPGLDGCTFVDMTRASLQATTRRALRALADGACHVAIAGGVGMLPDGRGEGVGIVVLRPLDAALAAGRRIHAVVGPSDTVRGATNRPVSATDHVWEFELSQDASPWHHVVQGKVVFPAARYLSAVLAAGGMLDGRNALAGVALPRGLGSESRLRVAISIDQRFTVWGRAHHEATWRERAHGYLVPQAMPSPDHLAFPGNGATGLPKLALAAEVYQRLATQGINCRPGFRPIERLHLGHREALAELALMDDDPSTAWARSDAGHAPQPALIDGALQALIVAWSPDEAPVADGLALLPASIDDMRWYRSMGRNGYAFCRITSVGAWAMEGDVILLAADGSLCGELLGIRYQQVAAALPMASNETSKYSID
jgi:acyl transferase domain-containing protein